MLEYHMNATEVAAALLLFVEKRDGVDFSKKRTAIDFKDNQCLISVLQEEPRLELIQGGK